MVVIRGQTVTPDPHALAGLFPSDVVVAVADDRDEPSAGFPEEEAALLRAVPRRQREFRIGRQCARAALGALGAPAGPIRMGRDRGPIWPRGFVGSITHCDGFVGACVARIDAYEGIGFDAESATTLDPEIVPNVCTPAERSSPTSIVDGKTLFAAKEALHKCVAPTSGIMLDFQDVTIELDRSLTTFRAILEPHAPSVPAVSRVEGRFLQTDSMVFALALLRRQTR